MAKATSKSDVLKQIKNPLNFFALSLLLVEGMMGAVVTFSRMIGDQQFYCFLVMAGLFLVVVGAVTWITIKLPGHLYEDVVRGLQSAQDTKKFIESDAFRDTVEQIVDEMDRSHRNGSSQEKPQ